MLAQTKYDPETKRAYIELRDQDDDGSDVAVVVIFSLQTTAGATQRTIEQEILRKALHPLTSATWHTQWRLSVGFGRRPFAPGALKMTPQILNTIGIALSMLGAVLIFIWAPRFLTSTIPSDLA